jgi:hypothetical protein
MLRLTAVRTRPELSEINRIAELSLSSEDFNCYSLYRESLIAAGEDHRLMLAALSLLLWDLYDDRRAGTLH